MSELSYSIMAYQWPGWSTNSHTYETYQGKRELVNMVSAVVWQRYCRKLTTLSTYKYQDYRWTACMLWLYNTRIHVNSNVLWPKSSLYNLRDFYKLEWVGIQSMDSGLEYIYRLDFGLNYGLDSGSYIIFESIEVTSQVILVSVI